MGCAQFDSKPLGPEVRLDAAQYEAPPPCPVSGKPVNFATHIKRPDGVVYFCDSACIKEYRAAPDAYADLVDTQREILKYRPRVQVLCPITGDPISKRRFTGLFGERVYFCGACGACPRIYEEEPERYQAALDASYSYQVSCPATGREISPKVFVELPDGQRIYFCSRRCLRKYNNVPELFSANLAAQGLFFDHR